MAYTLVRANTVLVAGSSTSTISPTCTSTTAGNLLVACLSLSAGSTQTVTGPSGWSRAVFLNSASFAQSEIWYYPNNPGGITSATFSWSVSSLLAAAMIYEFSDPAGSNATPRDVTGTATGTSTPEAIATGSATTAANELAVTSFYGHYSSATKDTVAAGSGFTQGGQYGNGVKQSDHGSFDYQLNTGATGVKTDSVAFTGPFSQACGVIATFQIATTAVSILPQQTQHRFPARFTRLARPPVRAVYGR